MTNTRHSAPLPGLFLALAALGRVARTLVALALVLGVALLAVVVAVALLARAVFSGGRGTAAPTGRSWRTKTGPGPWPARPRNATIDVVDIEAREIMPTRARDD